MQRMMDIECDFGRNRKSEIADYVGMTLRRCGASLNPNGKIT